MNYPAQTTEEVAQRAQGSGTDLALAPAGTEIILILDKSSSMYGVTSEAIRGVNFFMNDQRKAGDDANFSLLLFSNDCDMVVDGEPISSVKNITRTTYRTGGGTALYDAIGKGINRVWERTRWLPEDKAPEHVIVAVLTDGFENGSKEFDFAMTYGMVRSFTEKYGWAFVFISMGDYHSLDGGSSGKELGFNHCITVTDQQELTGEALRKISSTVKKFRSTGIVEIEGQKVTSDYGTDEFGNRIQADGAPPLEDEDGGW